MKVVGRRRLDNSKQPPCAPDLEKSILGNLMLNSCELDEVLAYVNPNDFYDPSTRKAFNYMVDNMTTDMLEVESACEVDVADYTMHMGSGWERHCKVVHELSLKRKAIQRLYQASQKLYDDDSNLLSEIDSLNEFIFDIDKSTAEVKALTPTQIYHRELNQPQAEQLLTGVSALDKKLFADAGLRRSQNTVVQGESSHGKTQVMMMIVRELLRKGYKGYWAQLEDTDVVTANYFMDMLRDEGLYDNLKITMDLMHIDDVCREAKRIKMNEGLDFMVHDNVQLSETNAYSKFDRVEETSDKLTKLYKQIKVAGLTGSQCTIKNSNERNGWNLFPKIGDWKHAKKIIEDASMVVSVFRPNVIESLQEYSPLGKRVKAPDGNGTLPYNSVFIKPVKIRGGILISDMVHLLHTPDNGLQLYSGAEI